MAVVSAVSRVGEQEEPDFAPHAVFTDECDCVHAVHPHVKCKSKVTGPDGKCDTCRGKHEKSVHYWDPPELPDQEAEQGKLDGKNVPQQLGM